jgi:hypothetical protein
MSHSTGHLGERVTPLVDGELDGELTDRAHAHLAACRSCREAVDAERLIKRRLAVLVVPPVQDEFLSRLLQLAGPAGPLPPRPGYVPGSPRPRAVPAGPPPRRGATHPLARLRSSRPGARRRVADRVMAGALGPRGRLVLVMAGAACLVGVGVGVAADSPVGGRSPGPRQADQFVLESALVTGMLPTVTATSTATATATATRSPALAR